MQIGFVGLGRMGGNMVLRLLRGGHKVVAYNRSPAPVKAAEAEGAQGAYSLQEMVRVLAPPRAVWVMVPSGQAVTQVLAELAALLSRGDIIVEGGNSNYKDTVRRAEEIKAKGLHFLDAGTSGGIWGLKNGYCLMIGGDKEPFKKLEPVFSTLAPAGGYLYAGPSGAGHYVKMVHNGIEYGMLQAYAEGFEILKASGYPLDLAAISHLWNQGSVVRSWLLELAESVFGKDPELKGLEPFIDDSGEGRWTVAEAIEKNVPAPVITLSLIARLQSRDRESFGARVIAAMRNEFGGHAVKKAGA